MPWKHFNFGAHLTSYSSVNLQIKQWKHLDTLPCDVLSFKFMVIKFILSGLKDRCCCHRKMLAEVAADLIAQTLQVAFFYHRATAGEVGRLRFEYRIPEPWGSALSWTGPLCYLSFPFELWHKRTWRESAALWVSAEVLGMPFRSAVTAFCCRTSGIKFIPAVIPLVSRVVPRSRLFL